MATNYSIQLPPGFNRLAWSNLTAQSAEQIFLVAAPIVAVLAFGAGPGETGLLQTVLTVPFVLFAIPAGLMADRVSRRRLMAAAEILRALSLLTIVALNFCNLLTLYLLALFGFVAVCGTVTFSVTAPSLVSALVSAQMLPAANARIELARTTAFAAGPALGGVLVGWTGVATAFGVAAILSGLAVLLLSGIHEPSRQAINRRHPLQELREGALFVFRHRLLVPVFVTQFLFNTAFFLILAIFVPHAVQHLGLSASGVGLTLGMLGVGMVLGALLAPRIISLLPFGTVITIGPFTGLGAAILMGLTIWLPSPLLAGLSFFLFGVGPIIWVISTTTLRQTITPQHLLGRVSAINIMAYGARPIGAGLGALIGSLYGVEACLLMAIAGFALQALVIAVSPTARLEHQPKITRE